jgi:hypothetical protein
MFDNNGSIGVYPYIGGGLMTPGPGATVTFSPDNVSGGFNAELQGSYGVAGAIGVDEGGNSFTSFGGGAPGASATVYYVFFAPHPVQPTPGPRRAVPNAAVNTNSNGSRNNRPPNHNCTCNSNNNIP